MADRIDEFLDGRVDGNALTRDERQDADAVMRAIHQSRTFLAQRSAPDLTPQVMARITSAGPSAIERHPSVVGRLAALLWTPRLLSVRPAYAALALAACVALVWLTAFDRRPLPPPSTGPRVFVQFRLEASDAMRVQLAGSFTNWQPRYELHQSAPGIWTTLVPLTEGVHDYAFVVDGRQWVADPYSAQISDGFGGTNSRVTLLVPDTPRS
jgi:hypothetical protein